MSGASHPGRGAWIETPFCRASLLLPRGRTPGGVRGLKRRLRLILLLLFGRTPGGVRGLKPRKVLAMRTKGKSHPGRGAWIETAIALLTNAVPSSRTPPGVRGLKPLLVLLLLIRLRRTPPGVRGLKRPWPVDTSLPPGSHPTRGAWIETQSSATAANLMMSHPTRGAWIETKN